MKKISLFMLMIFGIFMLFAADTAPETAQENAVEPETAQAPAETAPEQAQPAENAQEPAAAEPEQPAETAQEPAAAEPEQPAENVQEPVETSPETSPEPEQPAEPVQPRSENPQKVEYYRPYLGAGVPLIVIGSVSFLIMMPAMGTMAFAASDACEGKDWDFCEELHDNNKKHHTAWTVGSVMTGVVGAGMIAVGSWLTSVEKPRKNQPLQLSAVSVLPKKNGMFASVGFKF
ncbi:hypothetical protein J5690_03110 [bacterium]|nr:hypothetical protein [bacterium]